MIQKQAAGTAEAVGLNDRGTIEPGKKADLNVIDLEHLTLHPPRSVDDLPAGGRRILQDASGYVATIVSGVVTRRRRPGHRRPAGSPRAREFLRRSRGDEWRRVTSARDMTPLVRRTLATDDH